MNYWHKWFVFIKERFNPVFYLPMLLVFFGANYVVVLNTHLFGKKSLMHFVLLAMAVFLFFFKMRLFDELKDAESDAIYHPKRPLPRGLLPKKDVLWAVWVIIFLEILFFGYYGFNALASGGIAIGYSLLMYKEFFLKKWLRAHLTIYALSHTFVVVFISFVIFSALLNETPLNFPNSLVYFSFGNWFIFNIFEFGRKTFASSEEIEGVNSYSKIFGRFGAVLLVLTMSAFSTLLISKPANFPVYFLVLSFVTLAIAGFLFAVTNSGKIGKIYRFVASFYIIFIYGEVIVLLLNQA